MVVWHTIRTFNCVEAYSRSQILKIFDRWSYFVTTQQMKCLHFFVFAAQNLVFLSLIRTFATKL